MPTPQVPAADQTAQQPLAWFGATRAPLAVVDRYPAGGLEDLVDDDARNLDRDPVLAGSRNLPSAFGGMFVRDGLRAVEVDPADVGLVAQQPTQRRMSQVGLPLGWDWGWINSAGLLSAADADFALAVVQLRRVGATCDLQCCVSCSCRAW